MAKSTDKTTTTRSTPKKTSTKKKVVAKKNTAAKKAPAKKKATVKKKTVAKPQTTAKKRVAKKTAAKPASRSISAEERRGMIAEAAYLRAESQGFLSDEQHDWLSAEQEVDQMLSQAKVKISP